MKTAFLLATGWVLWLVGMCPYCAVPTHAYCPVCRWRREDWWGAFRARLRWEARNMTEAAATSGAAKHHRSGRAGDPESQGAVPGFPAGGGVGGTGHAAGSFRAPT